jgi:hypothetical protein
MKCMVYIPGSHESMESLTASMCFTLPVMLLPGMGTNPDFRLSSNCEITLTDSMVAHPF